MVYGLVHCIMMWHRIRYTTSKPSIVSEHLRVKCYSTLECDVVGYHTMWNYIIVLTEHT